MRPLVVVAMAEARELGGAMGQIAPRVLREAFLPQSAVEAFLLALGLGMIGPAMPDRDAIAQQPDRERRIGTSRFRMAPRRPVVAEDAIGQAVLLEDGLQRALHGRAGLVGLRREQEVEAAMVVQHGQRMAAHPGLSAKVAFKIHLPQFIGLGAFEALKGSPRRAGFRADQLGPAQDLGAGAGRGHRRVLQFLQSAPQLAPAPGRMLLAQLNHRLRGLVRALLRRSLRPARPVRQCRFAACGIALQPLVAGLRADAVSSAPFFKADALLLRQLHKLQSLGLHGFYVPGHPLLLPMSPYTVTHVSGLYTPSAVF